MDELIELSDYEFSKEISLQVVFDEGSGKCFMINYVKFCRACDTRYVDPIPVEHLRVLLNDRHEWKDWFVANGLLVPKKVVTYTRGDQLIDAMGEKGRIVVTGCNEACIVVEGTWNRWVAPIKVEVVTRITESEFQQMQGMTGTWRKVEPSIMRWRRYRELPPYSALPTH